jgi:hypothetical protein
MHQPVDTSGLEMDMLEDVFRVMGKIIVVVPHIIDLFTDGWFKLSILQIAYI